MKTIATMAAVLMAGTMLTATTMAKSVGAPLPRYIGTITGDPEKDSFGYRAADLLQPRTTAVLLSEEAQYVGRRTGDEEKDTFARVEVRPKLSAGLNE